MANVFRLSGAFLVAAIVALLGISTFTFSATQGELKFMELSESRVTGAGRNTRSVIPPDRVRYSYLVNNVPFESSSIGMGFRHWTLTPLHRMKWEEKARIGSELTIYYFSPYPAISVLYRGIDVVVTATFVLLGFGLRYVSQWLGLESAAL